MAPQTHIPMSANVLGTLGTVFWSIQLIPQIWQNWRKKKTDGMPSVMMMIWAISAIPYGVYAVVQNFNIPLQIQPHIFGALSLVTWAQILVYSSKWPPLKATALAIGLFVIFAGLEALLILTLRGRGLGWPVTTVGIIAAILLTVGTVPPYPEMWRRGGRVVGINFFFLGMDSLGAYFSLFALVAQEHFDSLGGTFYIGVIVLEAGIFLSHIVWLFRTRKLRKRAKIEGKSFDDLPEARRWQSNLLEQERRASSRTSDLEMGHPTADQVSTEPKTSAARNGLSDLDAGEPFQGESVENQQRPSTIPEDISSAISTQKANDRTDACSHKPEAVPDLCQIVTKAPN